jgi:hypothetical protein
MAKKKWTPAARRAFALKMKRARAAKQRGKVAKRGRRMRRKNPGGYRLMATRGHERVFFNGRKWTGSKSGARHYASLDSARTAGRLQLHHHPSFGRMYRVYVVK